MIKESMVQAIGTSDRKTSYRYMRLRIYLYFNDDFYRTRI